MKIELLDSFVHQLAEQVEYIAVDKPGAAWNFEADLLQEINSLPNFPFRHKKSRYFEDEAIRDFVFKGYTIVYKVDLRKNIILDIGLLKYREDLF